MALMHQTLSLFPIAANAALIKSASPNTLSKECNDCRKSKLSTPDLHNPDHAISSPTNLRSPPHTCWRVCPWLKHSAAPISKSLLPCRLLVLVAFYVFSILRIHFSFFTASSWPIFLWLGWAVAWAHKKRNAPLCCGHNC